MEKWTGRVVMALHMNGIQQKELAEELGCGREHLNMVLNGHRKSTVIEKSAMDAINRIVERRKVEANVGV